MTWCANACCIIEFLLNVIDLEGNGIRVRERRVSKANEDKMKVHQMKEANERKHQGYFEGSINDILKEGSIQYEDQTFTKEYFSIGEV